MIRNKGKILDSTMNKTPTKFMEFINKTKEIIKIKRLKSAYDDKKGWHIKESKLDKIVSESVKKLLKEYDILDDDEPYYNDTSEPKNIKNWYDESEETYDVAAMIKSDMNPLSHTFKATSIHVSLH